MTADWLYMIGGEGGGLGDGGVGGGRGFGGGGGGDGDGVGANRANQCLAPYAVGADAKSKEFVLPHPL